MEKINAVVMVRKIRDKQYEETKKMSRTDLLKYYKRNGEKALLKLRKTIWVAKLGGYLAGRNDDPPSTITLWEAGSDLRI
jgi:hypothetical protein